MQYLDRLSEKKSTPTPKPKKFPIGIRDPDLQKKKGKIGTRKPKTLVFILIILVILGGLIGFSYYQIKTPQVLAEPVTFEIKKGEGVDEISKNLKSAGLIRSVVLFKAWLVFTNKSPEIQAGRYTFSDSVTTPKVIEVITTGVQNQITIWEGMRIEEMADFLKEKETINQAEDFVKQAKAKNYKDQFSFLAGLAANDSLEGFLFPDTYEFEVESSVSEIIEIMLENFQTKVWEELVADFEKSDQSLAEIIILASIIEREVPQKDTKRVVAGIYFNRLEQGMELEADPTVQYAKDSENSPKNYKDFWGEISISDYRAIISPYNTYLNSDLPPGAICNPGLDSIKAALDPEQTDYLYFFTPNDEIHYSRTAQEHEAKKEKYLK